LARSAHMTLGKLHSKYFLSLNNTLFINNTFEIYLTVLNNFNIDCSEELHEKPVVVKSSEESSDLVRARASRPYNKLGIHLLSTNCRTTSSEAIRPILPKIAFAERSNAFLLFANHAISYYLRRLASGEGIVVVGVCLSLSVCHARRCPLSRDCRCVALVSAAKVMRCIQCCLVNLFFI